MISGTPEKKKIFYGSGEAGRLINYSIMLENMDGKK